MAKAADRTITQPSQRVFTTWTPALLKAAFLQAEQGNVRLAAELCDNMLADDRINTVYETRIGGLLGLPITFEASGDGRRKNKAVRALEADEDWWEMFPESELWPLLVWGRHFGVSFGQLHPTEHEGRIVPRLEFWHPRNTRYDWNKRIWFARTQDGAFEVPIEPGGGQWIVYAPYGQYRPWASGLWRGLARWWLLKSYAQDDAGRRSEKSGLTLVEDKLAGQALMDGKPAVELRALRKEIAQDFADAARDAVIVLPSGFEASLLESRDTILANQGAIVDMANGAIAISVLGQNLTTEVKGGSYAAAAVHSRVEIQRIRGDGETASTTLHDQALEWWAEYNFGDESLAPWPMWRTDPPTDQVARAAVIAQVATAIATLRNAGFEIDPDDIETDFDLKLVAVAPPEPAPAPLAAAGAALPADQGGAGPASPDAVGPPKKEQKHLRHRATAKVPSRAKRYENSPRPPDAAIAAYELAMRGLVKRWWDKTGTEALAKAEKIGAAAEARAANSEDSSLADHSAALVDSPSFSTHVTGAAKAVHRHNAAEFKRLGIKVSELGLTDEIDAFRKENVGLVQSLLDDERNELEQILADGAGRRAESLIADIEERFGIATRHAELIATDQCLKLNASITQTQMANAGVTRFVWTTAGDERVRTRHSELDGKTFDFDDPPITNDDGEANLPGEDYQCRCVPYPVLPELEEE